jgi:hypothetical protein
MGRYFGIGWNAGLHDVQERNFAAEVLREASRVAQGLLGRVRKIDRHENPFEMDRGRGRAA